MYTSSSILAVLLGTTLALVASCDVPIASEAQAKPLTREPRLDSNASCKECHKAVFSRWRSSRHSKAGRNPAFDFEYNSHPGKWCMGCHAPRSTADLKLTPARRQGVDCLTCHVQDGILHSRSRAPSSPHKTKAREDFGGPEMCAGCHQFNFPVLSPKGDLVRYTKQPMQNTFAEFRDSGSGAECIDCHMQRDGHRFPGAYVSEKVLEALKVDLCRDATGYQVAIENALSAHNLPSGGVNRAIVLSLESEENPSGRRHYRMERLYDGPVGARKKRKDTTLQPGAKATWKIAGTLLGLGKQERLILAAQFYFGTDPNPKAPKAKVQVFKRGYAAQDIERCELP